MIPPTSKITKPFLARDVKKKTRAASIRCPNSSHKKTPHSLAELSTAFSDLKPLLSPSKNEEPSSKNSDASSKRIVHLHIAQYLLKHYQLMRDGAHLYLYNHELGYYELLHDGIGANTFDSFVRTNISESTKEQICSYDINESFKWLVSNAVSIESFPDFQPRHLVAFKNGTLDLRTLSLNSHSYKNKLTIGVNAKYIEIWRYDITKTTFWSFINRLADYDDKTLEILRIIIGLALSNVRKLKRLFYIVGVSNNGKSVLGDLILGLLPQDSCSALEIAELSDRFSRGLLYGKHFNISSDENTSTWPSESVAFLKKAVAGDVTKGENKYQPPFMFRCKALFLCLSNGMPCYKQDLDAGGAISKRLYIVPTTNKPITDEEEDFQILDKMLSERDMIASWAIDSVSDIVNTGILPEKIIDSKPQEFYLDFHTVFEYWSEAYISDHDKNAQTTSTDFFESFKEYANDYNVMYNEKAFYMKLAEKYKPYKRHNKKSFYIGLSIVHNDDPQIDYQEL